MLRKLKGWLSLPENIFGVTSVWVGLIVFFLAASLLFRGRGDSALVASLLLYTSIGMLTLSFLGLVFFLGLADLSARGLVPLWLFRHLIRLPSTKWKLSTDSKVLADRAARLELARFSPPVYSRALCKGLSYEEFALVWPKLLEYNDPDSAKEYLLAAVKNGWSLSESELALALSHSSREVRSIAVRVLGNKSLPENELAWLPTVIRPSFAGKMVK